MTSLMVIASTNTTPSLKGALSRWLIEVKPGVFCGRVSKSVREKLWEASIAEDPEASIVMVYQSNCDQGFIIHSNAEKERKFKDYDGITLPSIDTHNKSVTNLDR